MTCCDSVRYIESVCSFGQRPGLMRLRAILHELGDPQEKIRFVHVTGTNGKGSVCAMIEACLRMAGHKTGMFMSPYVDDFRERIQIDGRLITECELSAGLARVKEASRRAREKGHMAPTQFELETAIAFDFFARAGVEIAVVEVGVGGGHDCTNVIPAPLAAVITPVSSDHTAVLGSTVDLIAEEKCGIIKNDCPVISSLEQPEPAMKVIRRRADNLVLPVREKLEILSCGLEGSKFLYDGLKLTVPMAGKYQISNAITAALVCRTLDARGIAVSDENIRGGIASVRLPGRAEVVRNNPTCILDGGHNLAAVTALCGVLDMIPSNCRIIVVMAMFADKDYAACIERIASRASSFIASSSHQPRSLDPKPLATLATNWCPDCCWNDDIVTSAKIAMTKAGVDDVVLVCGSIYNIHDARVAME